MSSNYPNQNNNNIKTDNTIIQTINSLVIDLDKVESKFKEFNAYCIGNDNDLINCINEEPILDSDKKREIMNATKEKLGELIKKHRDIHTSISKFGKTTDKIFNERIDHLNAYFINNTDSTINNDGIADYDDAINLLIFDYLLRIGCVEAASAFLEEEAVNLSNDERCILSEVSSVISSIHERDFVPVKKWIECNKDNMTESQVIKFQYTIAKLEFLNVLSSYSGRIETLIDYAKQMGMFAHLYQPDFEYLMGSLAFIHSPVRMKEFYSELFVKTNCKKEGNGMECDVCEDDSWPGHVFIESITNSPYYYHYVSELVSMFSEQVCIMKQCTHIDPLFTLFTSGIQNITEFFNHDQIFKKLYLFSNIEHLPLTVKKHNNHFQHSIFHCPVDKAVASGDNSILRLKCGHAISKSAYNQLTKNEQRTKMKCPYCPMETKTNEVLKLTL